MKTYVILNFDDQENMYEKRASILDKYNFKGNACLNTVFANNGFTDNEFKSYSNLLKKGWEFALYAGVGERPKDTNDLKLQSKWDKYIGEFIAKCKENGINPPNVYHCVHNKLGIALYESLVKYGFGVIRCEKNQYKTDKSVFIKKRKINTLVVPTTGITKNTNILYLKFRILKAIILGYSLSIMAHCIRDDHEFVEEWNCSKEKYCNVMDFLKKVENFGLIKIATWSELYDNVVRS